MYVPLAVNAVFLLQDPAVSQLRLSVWLEEVLHDPLSLAFHRRILGTDFYLTFQFVFYREGVISR